MTTNEVLQFQNELLTYQLEILKLEICKIELINTLEINKLKTLLKEAQLN